MSSIPRRLAIAALAALSLSTAAFAQPHMRAMQSPGDVAMAIAALKGQLNLNTSQQAMWDNAITASKAAREQGRANWSQVHDALASELGKAEPDLGSVAVAGDAARAKNAALRQQVRSQWLALYATFTPDQKAVVRDSLKQRLARIDAFRARVQQWRSGTTQ